MSLEEGTAFLKAPKEPRKEAWEKTKEIRGKIQHDSDEELSDVPPEILVPLGPPGGARSNPWGLVGINANLEMDKPKIPDPLSTQYRGPFQPLPPFPYKGPYFPPAITPGMTGYKQHSGNAREEFVQSFMNRVTFADRVPLRQNFGEDFAELFWEARELRMKIEKAMRKNRYSSATWELDEEKIEPPMRPFEIYMEQHGIEYESGDTTVTDDGPPPKKAAMLPPPVVHSKGQPRRGNRGGRQPTAVRRSPRNQTVIGPGDYDVGTMSENFGVVNVSENHGFGNSPADDPNVGRGGINPFNRRGRGRGGGAAP